MKPESYTRETSSQEVARLRRAAYADTVRVIKLAAMLTGKLYKDILSKSRNRELVDIRIAISNVCEPKYGCSVVGKALRKNHATICHHVELHSSMMRMNRYNTLYDALLNTDATYAMFLRTAFKRYSTYYFTNKLNEHSKTK